MGAFSFRKKEGDTMYPRVYDINNNLVAILDKAFKIGYTKIKNNLWTCQFTLPLNDKKNNHVKPKYFIDIYDHDRRIGKFIVNPKKTIKNESTNEITYECEHVLSTLHSDVLFGYFQYSNYTTEQVIEFLLQQQEVKHWKKGTIAFTRYFHYSFENEDSLANAIFSVPKPFDVPYLWTYDDSVYPFELNLVEPPTQIKDIIASGKNLRGIEVDEDPTNIVTRIFPLGAGEGVNQLTIKSVNNGIPYLQNDEAVAEYGVHKRIWVDRRFTDAESLMASGQGILDKFSKPIKSIAIDCRDYTLYERKRKRELMAEYDVGDMLLVHDQDTNTHEEIRLEKIEKSDIYGAPQDIQLELGSLVEDISMTFTDLEKKQLVNDTYSQGSTNILNADRSENADPTHPIKFKLRIPEDAVNINFMELTWETDYFRGYTKGSKAGGYFQKSSQVESKSTATGGAYVKESVIQSKSTASGGSFVKGSSIVTSDPVDNWGNWEGNILPYLTGFAIPSEDSHRHGVSLEKSDFIHTHKITVPGITIPDHVHEFSVTIPRIDIPNHFHNFSVTIPAIEIPEHTHEQIYGIYEHDKLPTKLEIKVDGNIIPQSALSGENLDITQYLAKDSTGKIRRNRFAEIEIRPVDELAQISVSVIWGLFIQSHKGSTL